MKTIKAVTAGATVALAICLTQSGCGKRDSGAAGGSDATTTLQVQGSDTMVNVAQAWAEAYHDVKPNVKIEVGGGGSGVGIANIINGTIEIANASRDMKPAEREKLKANTGKEAKEFVVGLDCLAIYVHKDNPMNEITTEQLAAIYAEGGNINKWSDLGVNVPGCGSGEIIRISRQSNSGTYEFMREHILNKKDFKLGSRDMNGSKEVVETVTTTPCAIGYSGMGYSTPNVKMLKVSTKAGAPAILPTVETAQNKTYPIARPLFIYTAGEPEGAAKDYISWILSDAGQKIVSETGYVPLAPEQRAKLN